MRERLAAWLVTGPLGHFAAGALDWTTPLAAAARRAALARRRRRSHDPANNAET